MLSTRGLPFGPNASNPKANITENKSTGMTSPSAKAPTALSGTRFSRNWPNVIGLAGAFTAVPASVFKSTCILAPGAQRFTRSKARTRAIVVTTSK